MDIKMFWQKKTNICEDCQRKLSDLGDKFHELVRDFNELRDRLDKLEIKALESRKLYHNKLKKLYGDEKEKTESNINTSPFLSPNGDII